MGFSKHDTSRHSLPISLEKHTSFAQFIAEEKHNLQFFPSYKQSLKIIDNEKDKNTLIKNFNLLSYVGNNYYSPLRRSRTIENRDYRKTTVYKYDSSNISLSSLSNKSNTKKTKFIITTLTHQTKCITNINRQRHSMRCIERHIHYMTHYQTKAALCFILQLNSYMNQNILPLQTKYYKNVENSVQSSKLDNSSEKTIEHHTTSTSSLKFVSKFDLNDAYLVETDSTINISIDSSNISNSSSQLVLNRNNDLLAFDNQPIINTIYDNKTTNVESNDLSSGDQNNIYNIAHLFLDEEDKIKNQHVSISTINYQSKTMAKSNNKAIGCCCGGSSLTKSKSKINHNKIQKSSDKSEINDKMSMEMLVPQFAHITNISAMPLQLIQSPVEPIKHTEMINSTSDRTDTNIYQQSTILNSSLTDHNYNISKSSIDLHRLFTETNEQKSTIPLHSQCLVSFEFANRDEHLLEVIELPRSSYRISRMDIYRKVHARLAIVNLFDIDLTALLKIILQSFP